MDFPAEIATLNRRLRISRMRSKRSSDCDVSVPVTLPLDRGRIEELKGLQVFYFELAWRMIFLVLCL